MAIFSSTTFPDANGTALTAHTNTVTGGTWLRNTLSDNNTGNPPVIHDGAVWPGQNSVTSFYIATETPDSTDYPVSATVVSGSSLAFIYPGVLARCQGSSTATAYGLQHIGDASSLRIAKWVAGAGAYVASVSFPGQVTTDPHYKYILEVAGTGSTVTLTGYVQRTDTGEWRTSAGAWQSTKVSIITYSDTASDRIVTAGNAGIILSGNIAEVSMTDFSAGVPPVGPTITGPSGAAGATTSTASLPENSSTGPLFSTDIALTGGYPTLTGTDASLFTIVNTSGNNYRVNPVTPFNYEALPHANPFVVTFNASASVSQTCTITITDVVENATAIITNFIF